MGSSARRVACLTVTTPTAEAEGALGKTGPLRFFWVGAGALPSNESIASNLHWRLPAVLFQPKP